MNTEKGFGMRFPDKATVERVRQEYPAGCRVELVRMDDPQAPPPGTLGTVRGVDETGSIMVSWDNGSSLHVVYGEDMCRKKSAVKQITADDLRGMDGQEGLVIQGCGGDPQEWVDGINNMLTEAGILKDGTKFEAQAVCAFQHGECSNLLFPFDSSVKLDMGKLAMWRLATHDQFGGTWLSDFVPNRLGGFVHEQQQPERVKPPCPLIGANGNIYNLMGIAAGTLRENGMEKEAVEMTGRITGGSCHSYNEALCIISEYVEPTDILSERPPKHNHKKARNMNER